MHCIHPCINTCTLWQIIFTSIFIEVGEYFNFLCRHGNKSLWHKRCIIPRLHHQTREKWGEEPGTCTSCRVTVDVVSCRHTCTCTCTVLDTKRPECTFICAHVYATATCTYNYLQLPVVTLIKLISSHMTII